MSKHLMIDLETLDKKTTAAFPQIGWALFDWSGFDVQARGLIRVDVDDAINNYGLTMDWDTMKWWLQQDAMARDSLCQPGELLRDALANFGNMPEIPWTELDGVWSHGACFDLPILDHAYRKVFYKAPPWHHKQARDTRTVFALVEPVWPAKANNHCADQDAVNQVIALQSCYTKLKKIHA